MMATRKQAPVVIEGEEEVVEGPKSIEEDLLDLESIVEALESDQLPIEQSIALFQKGMQISAETRKKLSEAETRVEILMKRGGAVEPEPFEK